MTFALFAVAAAAAAAAPAPSPRLLRINASPPRVSMVAVPGPRLGGAVAAPSRSSDFGSCPVPVPAPAAEALSQRRQRLVFRLQSRLVEPRGVFARPKGDAHASWQAVGHVTASNSTPLAYLRATQVQSQLIGREAGEQHPALRGQRLQLGLLFTYGPGKEVIMPVPTALEGARSGDEQGLGRRAAPARGPAAGFAPLDVSI